MVVRSSFAAACHGEWIVCDVSAGGRGSVFFVVFCEDFRIGTGDKEDNEAVMTDGRKMEAC
jgi:hypothetical protein